MMRRMAITVEVGGRFGSIVISARIRHVSASGNSRAAWSWRCDCGSTGWTTTAHLVLGRCQRCIGCRNRLVNARKRKLSEGSYAELGEKLGISRSAVAWRLKNHGSLAATPVSEKRDEVGRFRPGVVPDAFARASGPICSECRHVIGRRHHGILVGDGIMHQRCFRMWDRRAEAEEGLEAVGVWMAPSWDETDAPRDAAREMAA